MDPVTIAFTVVCALLALALILLTACVVKWLVGKIWGQNDSLISVRKDMASLAKVLIQHGYDHLADLATALSTGDLVEVVKVARWLEQNLKDPKLADAIFDTAFFKGLDRKLADTTGRVGALNEVGKWSVANPDACKAAGWNIAAVPLPVKTV